MARNWNTNKDRMLEIAGIEPGEQLTEAEKDLRKSILDIMNDTNKSQDQRVEDIVNVFRNMRD